MKPEGDPARLAAMEYPTFMGLPAGDVEAVTAGRIAVGGAAEATPYDPAEASHSAGS